jgi:alkaline phosphatase D
VPISGPASATPATLRSSRREIVPAAAGGTAAISTSAAHSNTARMPSAVPVPCLLTRGAAVRGYQSRPTVGGQGGCGVSEHADHRRHELDRRGFLGLAGTSTAALMLGTGLVGAGSAGAAPRSIDYPFTLGVASGDPLPESVVLWTRLAPDPLAADGLGGMPDRAVNVRFEVAEDERFRKVVARGNAAADPELAHSVHVDAKGLAPGREYFYRFRAGNDVSPVGRTKTAPAREARVSQLSLVVVSCQHFEQGYFTAYRHILNDAPDLVAHCGDYIYESPSSLAYNPRRHVTGEPFDLRGYRLRYAQYRTDADLQRAHVELPWIFTFDDHEVDNNWARDVSYPSSDPEDWLLRRAAAFQAYYEHLPLRPERAPSGPDIPIHRRLQYGDLATLHVLDGRQFRDPQIPGSNPVNHPARTDPARTMLGTEQEAWLLDGLRRSRARWDVLVQQVPFTQLDEQAGAGHLFGKDNWNYFPAQRQRITDELARPGRNPIVLTGEIHRHLAAEVKADWEDPSAPVVASEFVATSVTTDGDGEPDSPWVATVLAENPHIPYARRMRGYARCRLDDGQWQTDFQVVPFISRPDAGVFTDASFVVEAGRPGLQRM